MKTLSIVLPTYNSSKFIERTLDCLLGQTYTALELIVIDDGSEDNTVEKIESYKATDRRIKSVVLEENRGPGHARNLGIQKSTGHYLTFFDHDDHQERNRYERMIRLMEKHQSEVCFSCAKEIGKNGKTKLLNENAIPEGPLTLPKDIHTPAIKRSIPPWSKIYLSEFVKREGLLFAEGAVHFDDVLFHSLLLVSMRSASIYPESCYTHIRNSESITDTVNIDKHREDVLYSFRACLNHPVCQGVDSLLSRRRYHVTDYYYEHLRRHLDIDNKLDFIDRNAFGREYKLLNRMRLKTVIKEGLTRRLNYLKSVLKSENI